VNFRYHGMVSKHIKWRNIREIQVKDIEMAVEAVGKMR